MKTLCELLILLSLHIFSLFVDAHLVVPDIPADILLNEKISTGDVALSSCEEACKAISTHLDAAVYLGTDGDNFDFWDAKKREIIPACRVEPNSALDVCFILKTLISHQCHFAVKSGGHERGTPGSSGHENGVIIDLVGMKTFGVANDRESVTIGPGWRWADLYTTLEGHGLMVLGGRLGEVGVGGLLLGGGISFHSNWRGLACDSILSYEVVLPNATIVTVSQDTQPELFRVMRGGGHTNFGIITSFTLEAFPSRQLWYANKAYNWEALPEVLEANHQVTTNFMNTDPHIAVMNVFMCYPKHRICVANILAQHANHNSTSSWPEPFRVYEELTGLPQPFSARIGPMSDITNVSNHASPIRRRTIYATFTYKPSVEFEMQLLAIFREEGEHHTLEGVAGWVPGIIMHPFSTTMLAMTKKRGGNSFSSVADHDGPLTVCNIAWQWNEKEDDAVVYDSYFRTMNRLEEAAKKVGLWHPYKYVNYAEASQNVFEHIPESEMEDLRCLQREIDPLGTFAYGGLVRGPFKLVQADGGSGIAEKLQGSAVPVKTAGKDEL